MHPTTATQVSIYVAYLISLLRQNISAFILIQRIPPASSSIQAQIAALWKQLAYLFLSISSVCLYPQIFISRLLSVCKHRYHSITTFQGLTVENHRLYLSHLHLVCRTPESVRPPSASSNLQYKVHTGVSSCIVYKNQISGISIININLRFLSVHQNLQSSFHIIDYEAEQIVPYPLSFGQVPCVKNSDISLHCARKCGVSSRRSQDNAAVKCGENPSQAASAFIKFAP